MLDVHEVVPARRPTLDRSRTRQQTAWAKPWSRDERFSPSDDVFGDLDRLGGSTVQLLSLGQGRVNDQIRVPAIPFDVTGLNDDDVLGNSQITQPAVQGLGDFKAIASVRHHHQDIQVAIRPHLAPCGRAEQGDVADARSPQCGEPFHSATRCQDSWLLCRVGKGRPAGSIELRVSPSPSKIPYGGFSPVRLQMDRQWRPSTTSRGLSAVHIRPMTPSYTPPQFSLPGIRDPRRDYPF